VAHRLVVGAETLPDLPGRQEHAPLARMGQRTLGRKPGGLLVRDEGLVEAPPERGDMAPTERVLVLLVERIAHTVTRSPSRSPRISTRRPFWACSRFSDCSQTRLRGPSSMASVISSPRWAGRQCMTS